MNKWMAGERKKKKKDAFRYSNAISGANLHLQRKEKKTNITDIVKELRPLSLGNFHLEIIYYAVQWMIL